jgi:hypothetical protein
MQLDSFAGHAGADPEKAHDNDRLNMSRVLVICRQRLGDIVACLPAARHLASTGAEVDFCSFPQYHSIFEVVSYCRPVGLEALARQKDYERVYDLEITRRGYDAYRASGIKWRDYVYGKYAEIAPARDEAPVFDRMPGVIEYQLPERYALACPVGISQVTRVDQNWFEQQCHSLSQDPWYVLSDKSGTSRWGIPLHARSLDHLPGLIANASTFVTINSAPNIIASGVRRAWHQVYEPGFGGQDNYAAPGQIVLHQPEELARHSWRFWVHYWRRRLMGIDVSKDSGRK